MPGVFERRRNSAVLRSAVARGRQSNCQKRCTRSPREFRMTTFAAPRPGLLNRWRQRWAGQAPTDRPPQPADPAASDTDTGAPPAALDIDLDALSWTREEDEWMTRPAVQIRTPSH